LIGGQASGFRKIAAQIARAGRRALRADSAVVLLTGGSCLRAMAVEELPTEAFLGLEVPLEPGESAYAPAPGGFAAFARPEAAPRCAVLRRAVEYGVRAGAAVPLVFGSRRLGTLAVHRTRESEFTEEEIDLLLSVAGVGGAALSHAPQAEVNPDWWDVLNQAKEKVTSAQNLEDGLAALRWLLRDYIDCHYIWIALRHGDVARGPSSGANGEPPVIELRMNEGIVGTVTATGRTILAPDVTKDPHYVQAIADTRSEVCTPIRAMGRVIGAINAESRYLNAFTRADAELLEAVGAYIGEELERLKLRDEALRRSGHEAALLQVASRVLEPSNLRAVLESILDQTQALFGYSDQAVLLLDHATNELYPVALRGYPQEIYDMRFKVGEHGIVGHVAATGEPYYSPHVPRDPRYHAGKLDTLSEVAFPLVVDGRVIGVLNVESPRPGDFPPEVRTVLEAFAALAALAIHRARLTEDLQRLSLTDELTSLANRRALLETLTREIAVARRTDRSLSVIMIEVDGFKRINDRYGHLRGDEVLISTARELKASLRAMDLATRYGGDEFVLILPNTGTEDARVVAERVRRKMPEILGQAELRITCSIGIASFPVDGDSPEALLNAADRAMYRVKKAGGDGVAAPGDAAP
jgi:diguanylate cyclase (GGDEF)-like protein